MLRQSGSALAGSLWRKVLSPLGVRNLSAQTGEQQEGYQEFETLRVTLPREGVMQVDIDRAKTSNAMCRQFFWEIGPCFQQLAADSDCRVVLLTGAGKHFSSGLDMKDHAHLFAGADGINGDLKQLGPKADVARRTLANEGFIRTYQSAFRAVDDCPKPVIAAMHGACVGGAVDLIACADVRYCSSDAYFSVAEVSLGLCADLGTLQRLPRLLGSDSLARELIYTARNLPASEALSSGLVSKVLEGSRQEVVSEALSLAYEIAQKSPIAVQGSKVNMNYSRDHSLDDALRFQAMWSSSQLQTSDTAASFAAMVSKKAPKYDDV